MILGNFVPYEKRNSSKVRLASKLLENPQKNSREDLTTFDSQIRGKNMEKKKREKGNRWTKSTTWVY